MKETWREDNHSYCNTTKKDLDATQRDATLSQQPPLTRNREGRYLPANLPTLGNLKLPRFSPLATTCTACKILCPGTTASDARANQGTLRHHGAPGKGKNNCKANTGDWKAEKQLPLPWVTEQDRSAWAKPPGSGGPAAPYTYLLCGQRNYNSHGDSEAA